MDVNKIYTFIFIVSKRKFLFFSELGDKKDTKFQRYLGKLKFDSKKSSIRGE